MNNDQIIFGEITQNPVQVLNHMIEYIYDPLLATAGIAEWGLADVDSKKQFTICTEKFKK